MKNQLLLVTPPFTQLNTPYPATAYLKGFLNTKNIASIQADLGIEVILELFSKTGLTTLFAEIETKDLQLSENAERIVALKADYIQTIDSVIGFLQGKNPSLAHPICQDDFLPEASRFNQLEELDWAFGIMGTQDKAKHLATLYLEDISDLIVETVDSHFGFSRYAERLGRSALKFDELYDALQQEITFTDKILLEILEKRFQEVDPNMVAFSVPFPGNLYAAFRCAQYIKKQYPKVKTAMGGGFPNTELRSVSDARVFEFFDFITLDDGEAPIENLVEYLHGKRAIQELKRTFALIDNQVVYINNSKTPDYKQKDLGTPDYSDLLLDQYISVIEIVNPMHRMWSDGRWNKLTMAHGCYWGKCTFCDISLDYIKIYEPATAKILVDRMEELILQTGQNGFHFVDEAAPPALMRELALEIIRRKLVVSWWTNIRFEKSFTHDLCILLKNSGCIAVSGGLEVASDRLLTLIDKGVTVSQVAKVTRNFTETGIMVHAYLMYGFPTQTVQETIDSLEMVRQLFETGVLQSGFWHQFAMTAHSPIGLNPEQFNVIRETGLGTFANNDLVHQDKTGIDHEQFSFGLKKSLYNFMHGIGFDMPLQSWFDFKIPRTNISPNFILDAIEELEIPSTKASSKIVWLGKKPTLNFYTKNKKGNQWEMSELTFHTKRNVFSIQVSKSQGIWLEKILQELSTSNNKNKLFQEIKSDYEKHNSIEDFEPFWYGKQVAQLKDAGLLVL
ncbi:B12-binding domain-containing radical SAM protein [Fluviicola taffensis]|uniref:Radical SAM domain protein n=1 Tax=Fluviicola taffensis (strain DSM 16823 / NCIMB 13979 / RW262) TaxID=755732 RepID=F2IFL3_FLUTR|nr:radical SAM protein [Fluviicola taffensis]AEA45727.1 Radical SAM domain protein [Fluviicola taffensis DSM 16823]